MIIVSAGGCENKEVIKVLIISQNATEPTPTINLLKFHPLLDPRVLVQRP